VPLTGRGTGLRSWFQKTASFHNETAAEATIVLTLTLSVAVPISVQHLHKSRACHAHAPMVALTVWLQGPVSALELIQRSM